MTMISSRFIESSGGSGVDPHPTHVPDKPEILSPLDGAENINQAPQIQCSGYRHHYNAPMYGRHIQVSASDNFAEENIVYELEELSPFTVFQIPIDENDMPYLEPDTEYFVRVRYQDRDLRWSPWSETSCFHTMTVFPETVLRTPLIVTPSDGGFIPAVNPLLAMSSPATLIGEAEFSAADWQIAVDRDFVEPLYSAADSTDLSIHETANVNLTSEGNVDFFVRGRQKTSGGLYTPWSAPAHVKRQPQYTSLIFGMRRIFSKRYGKPCIWQIDEDGNEIRLPKSYFNNHPLYAFPLKDITVSEGLTSSVAYIPPCWIKYAVYDNDDGDMVIDLWFCPYAKPGVGWMLHPTFETSPKGFYHGTCLAAKAQDNGGASYFVSQYDRAGEPLKDSSDFDSLNNLFGKDSSWHVWNIYERRLLLDLMQAEFATFLAESVSRGTGIANDNGAFIWRVFRGLTNPGKSSNEYLALAIDGIGAIARQYWNNVLQSLTITTPSGTDTVPLNVSILFSSNEYVSEILRGENTQLGFNIALLGLPAKIESGAPQAATPYGAASGVSMSYSTETTRYFAFSPDLSGLFTIIPQTSNTGGGTGYPRLSRSIT